MVFGTNKKNVACLVWSAYRFHFNTTYPFHLETECFTLYDLLFILAFVRNMRPALFRQLDECDKKRTQTKKAVEHKKAIDTEMNEKQWDRHCTKQSNTHTHTLACASKYKQKVHNRMGQCAFLIRQIRVRIVWNVHLNRWFCNDLNQATTTTTRYWLSRKWCLALFYLFCMHQWSIGFVSVNLYNIRLMVFFFQFLLSLYCAHCSSWLVSTFFLSVLLWNRSNCVLFKCFRLHFFHDAISMGFVVWLLIFCWSWLCRLEFFDEWDLSNATIKLFPHRTDECIIHQHIIQFHLNISQNQQ